MERLFTHTEHPKPRQPDMPNVLGLVSFRVFPTHMGGQKGVVLFYQHLQNHLNVLLAVSKDNFETDLVRTEKLLYPNKNIYLNFFKKKILKKIVIDNHIDVIVAEHSYSGWLAWSLHKSTGKPFIVHSHNIESKRFRQMHKWWWRLYKWYEAWIHKKAQFNFFISEADMNFAITNFKLSASNCSVITYGVEQKEFDRDKASLRKQSGLDERKIILLFNGTLDYQPNYEAVEILIDKIEPLLRKKLNDYEIIITGNRAPGKLIEKIRLARNMKYTGYVPDVDIYYRSADLFINPVSNDTGVKTKLIEAIANNCSAVSTESGASGIRKDLCANKLVVVNDYDWNSFVNQIMESLKGRFTHTPVGFYDYYSWETISKKASEKIVELVMSNE